MIDLRLFLLRPLDLETTPPGAVYASFNLRATTRQGVRSRRVVLNSALIVIVSPLSLICSIEGCTSTLPLLSVKTSLSGPCDLSNEALTFTRAFIFGTVSIGNLHFDWLTCDVCHRGCMEFEGDFLRAVFFFEELEVDRIDTKQWQFYVFRSRLV